MKAWIIRVLYLIHPGYFSLISGILLSSSINFFTGIYGADQKPNKWQVLLISTGLSLVSAIVWAVIGWNIDKTQRLALKSPSDPDATLQELAAPEYKFVTLGFIVALFTAFASFVILMEPVGKLLTHAASDTSKLHTQDDTRTDRAVVQLNTDQVVVLSSILAKSLTTISAHAPLTCDRNIASSEIQPASIGSDNQQDYLVIVKNGCGKLQTDALIWEKTGELYRPLLIVDYEGELRVTSEVYNGKHSLEVSVVLPSGDVTVNVYKWSGSKYEIKECIIRKPRNSIHKSQSYTSKPRDCSFKPIAVAITMLAIS